MQKDLSGSVKGRSFTFFFPPKCNLNCLCTPKQCLERGEMEEGWAGSCEGIVWEARAEDQALGKRSWCSPTAELQKREAGSEQLEGEDGDGIWELAPAVPQVISLLRAGWHLVLQSLQRGKP